MTCVGQIDYIFQLRKFGACNATNTSIYSTFSLFSVGLLPPPSAGIYHSALRCLYTTFQSSKNVLVLGCAGRGRGGHTYRGVLQLLGKGAPCAYLFSQIAANTPDSSCAGSTWGACFWCYLPGIISSLVWLVLRICDTMKIYFVNGYVRVVGYWCVLLYFSRGGERLPVEYTRTSRSMFMPGTGSFRDHTDRRSKPPVLSPTNLRSMFQEPPRTYHVPHQHTGESNSILQQ